MNELEDKSKDSTESHAAARGRDTALPNVLLVDDQPARLLTYESILEGVGVNCVRATSGKDALDKLLKQPFAVVLLDVMMPDMDGFETASLIRQHPRFVHTPIVFVTGLEVTEIDQVRGYEVGAVDYISLPLVPEILRSKVALLVELYKRRTELERLNRELEEARAALETRRGHTDIDEESRRERERRYRAIFEHPTDHIAVLEAVRDAQGKIIDWTYLDANSNALQLLNTTADELIGKRLSEVLTDRAESLGQLCARVLEDRAPYRYDGTLAGRTFQSCAFPIAANVVVCSGTDISVRTGAFKEVERRFRAESAERDWLAAVLDAITEEVYFTDTQQRYTYANPAALREFGHDDVTGVAVTEVVKHLRVFRPDGTARPIEEAPPLRALQGETIHNEEQIVRTPRTGVMRHRQVSAAPVRDASGAIIGSVSVVRDITDRKQAEAAVAADLRDTRMLHNLSAKLVVGDDPRQLYDEILGAAMAISRADGGTIQLLEESTRELTFAAIRGIKRALWSQFERVDAASGSPCGQALASGERRFTIFDDPLAPDPDGSLRKHFEFGFRCAQSTPLISRSGRVLGMFSTHWKVRRELSERELRFLDLLARQAADLIERTQGEAELRKREQALRESDRHKDEFIAVLAHELRNPLVPIRNGIELLKNARARPGLVDTVRPMMERQLGHVVRLIDDLLDVARISAGKIELKYQHVELSAVIAGAVEATRAALDAARVELTVDIADPGVMLDVDPTRLSQVISNILQNASKFTPAGGRVRLTTRILEDAESPLLEIGIVDSGIGIAADELPRVFNLFAQSATRMRGHQGGLGIGLAIARRLIELHGGTVVARSEGADRGSEFTIRLPTLRQAPMELEARTEPQDSIQGTRVLIVDDNRDAADSMALLVELSGAVVRVAYSAEQGFELIAESQPDVVLMDIGMPGLNGYEACRRIRATHGHRITLIAVSGWGQEADKRLALNAGFDAHLTKPTDPETLERAIAHYLRAR